ncbi:hypothetical protein Vafri_2802 [Volvox africanus]|uniref:Uncharacterized protein n=1 Tax=Volvox africanus TaxID=51714 RepID=A0A8J4EU28_9CHLO|nr:hypothetical protein Vafri_2802 [Volvox africanus]
MMNPHQVVIDHYTIASSGLKSSFCYSSLNTQRWISVKFIMCAAKVNDSIADNSCYIMTVRLSKIVYKPPSRLHTWALYGVMTPILCAAIPRLTKRLTYTITAFASPKFA